MKRSKAFVVVGHSNWGKSATLKALTNNSRFPKWIRIKGQDIFVRRMSNDDDPHSLLKFLKRQRNQLEALLLTLCPEFQEPSRRTLEILKLLDKHFDQIVFWVLKKKYGGTSEVTQNEIRSLRRFGRGVVFSRSAEARVRAAVLRRFIAGNV